MAQHHAERGNATLSDARPSLRARSWSANDGTQVAKKAEPTKRLMAFAIDGVIAVALSFVPFVGTLLAGLYILVRDGLDLPFMDRRSVGKRVARLRPLQDDGSPMTVMASLRRNAPLSVMWFAIFLGPVPVIGHVVKPLGTALGIVVVMFEGYLALVDQVGLRWGDHLAGTRVVDSDA